MFKPAEESSSNLERAILRRVFVLLSVSTVFAVVLGVGIGVFVSERTARAGAEAENVKTAESLSSSFSEVARQVEPAVVNIDTKGKIPEQISTKDDKPPTGAPDDILEYFKRQLPRRASYAVGSGFIVDKSGYILTNNHVIEDSSRITVRLQSGEEYAATIVGTDELTDLAVLKIEAGKDLPSVRLGDSNNSQVGDWVLAIGSPFGLAQTVTAGIISQTKRETPYATPFQKFIQTDAAINRGNSGGPLVNMQGEVIGVNSQIATSTGDYNGIGFALPSSEAAYVYNQIRQIGKVRRGFLGVSLDTVKSEFGRVYEMPDLKGAIVTNTFDADSRAAKAGLQAGDIIIEFGNQPVVSRADLIAKVSAATPDSDAPVTFLREVNNRLERRTTVIKIGERPSAYRAADDEKSKKLTTDQPKPQAQPLGLTLVEPPVPAVSANAKTEMLKGLVVKDIDPASFVSDLKDSDGRDLIREGDLIQRINRVAVGDLKTFNDIAVKLKPGDAVVLHVSSNSRGRSAQQKRIVQFTVQ